MKRRRCDSPFSFCSTVPVHAFACMYTRTHVYACIYKPREHHGDLRFTSPPSSSLWPRIFSVNFPRLILRFSLCHLTRLPAPLPSSLFLFLIPLPTHLVSSSRGLDEKSEYATIFKWQPRDTLLNALFASPPTSPACLPFLSPSLHRPTVDGPFWLPTRQRRARCSVPD